MDNKGEKAPEGNIMEGGEEDQLNLDDDFDDKGEPNQFDDDGGFAQNDSEEADSANADEDDELGPEKKGSGSKAGGIKPEVKGEKLDNQPYDLAVDVNDSEEIESDEEDDEVNQLDAQRGAQNAQLQEQQRREQQAIAAAKAAQMAGGQPGAARGEEDEDPEDDKEVPGTYNPAEYANLQVGQDVKDLFEYIQRYKPQKIDLDTKLKPFIPDYVPAVGEVDACLKMGKPDGTKEDLGITQLDEPALNCEDNKVLEMQYVQSKKVVRAAPMTVASIENADKKPKEISRWIGSVQDLHKSRPPPTVNYTKQMPDFDDHLMIEMQPELEQALKDMAFPSGEIDMHSGDYARIILAMLDIPVHKLANNKSLIESLHVLFTLFSTFRSNQHFQPKGEDAVSPDLAGF